MGYATSREIESSAIPVVDVGPLLGGESGIDALSLAERSPDFSQGAKMRRRLGSVVEGDGVAGRAPMKRGE